MPVGSELAEGVGFKPTIRLRVCRFSRPVYSTTLAPLQNGASRLDNKTHGCRQERAEHGARTGGANNRSGHVAVLPVGAGVRLRDGKESLAPNVTAAFRFCRRYPISARCAPGFVFIVAGTGFTGLTELSTKGARKIP